MHWHRSEYTFCGEGRGHCGGMVPKRAAAIGYTKAWIAICTGLKGEQITALYGATGEATGVVGLKMVQEDKRNA